MKFASVAKIEQTASADRHSIPVYDLSMGPRPAERETRHPATRTESVRNKGGSQ